MQVVHTEERVFLAGDIAGEERRHLVSEERLRVFPDLPLHFSVARFVQLSVADLAWKKKNQKISLSQVPSIKKKNLFGKSFSRFGRKKII